METWRGKILNDKYRDGTILKDLEITDQPLVVTCYGFQIHENSPSEKFVYKQNGRKDYQLFYIKEGEFKFVSESGQTIHKENSLFLIKPGTPQNRMPLSDNNRCTHMFINFSGNKAEELLKHYNINEGFIYLKDRFYAFEDTINRMEAGKSGQHHEEFCNLLLGELLILISNRSERTPIIFKRGFNELLAVMNETCTQNLPIKYYADLIHFSEVYFVRFFKKAMGISPHKYLITQKMQKATHLLVYTNDSLKTISEKLGFSNQHYFSTMFFRYCKMSPSEYRIQNTERKKKEN